MQTARAMIHFTSKWAILVGVALSLPLMARGQIHYRLTKLGGFGTNINGHEGTTLSAINNLGNVVGGAGTYNAAHEYQGETAALWHNGTIFNVGSFAMGGNGMNDSTATALNDVGDVAGYLTTTDVGQSSPVNTAVVWHDGAMITLGNFGTDSTGRGESYAYGINAAGDVVGQSTAFDSAHNYLGDTALLYHNGTVTQLATNLGTNSNGIGTSIALAINDSGVIAGNAIVYDSVHSNTALTAVVWQNGTMIRLVGDFGTDNTGIGWSNAAAINAAGDVVGYCFVYDASHNNRGFAAALWHNNTLTNLGNFGTDSNGTGYSDANAINTAGDIVGSSRVYDANGSAIANRAFLYRNGRMLDLNTLIPADAGVGLDAAYGINDRGQIICSGQPNGSTEFGSEGFVLDPIVPGDFDGDGHADLLWQNPADSHSYIWLTNNRTLIGGIDLPSLPSNWQAVGTPDFNGDGKPDVLWQNTTTGDIGYWLLDKGHVLAAQLLATGIGTDWHVVSTADLNGDGHADIVWWNSKTGQAAVWYMSGTTVQNTALLASGISGWTLAGAMPHSGDSSVTLLWRSNSNGDLAYWTLKDTALQSSGMIASGVPQAWQVAGAVDMDGDNQPDILWQNSATGEAAVWYLNGTAFKSGSTIAGTSGTTWKLIGSR